MTLTSLFSPHRNGDAKRQDLMKELIGFSHRVAYAMAIAVVGLLLAALPAGASVDPSGLFTKALNLPLAATGLLLPDEWKTIDLWFGTNALHYADFSEVLLRHLRIAIPVYVLQFYLPNLFHGLYRLIKSRGGASQPRTEEQV
jgi:hypothetical protein